MKRDSEMLLTGTDGLLQVLNGLLLARVAVALLVVEPSELLENLGVVGVTIQDAPVRSLGRVELTWWVRMMWRGKELISKLTSFCCSWTWPTWNQMSSSVRGRGGSFTMYLKHCKAKRVSYPSTTIQRPMADIHQDFG